MPRKKKDDVEQLGLLEARVSTAPCVPGKVARVNAINRVQGWPMMRIHTPKEVLGL